MSVSETVARIKEQFPDAVLDVTAFGDEQILHIRARDVTRVLSSLKEGEDFNFLSDITAVDNLTLGGFERFVVVYHLLSHRKKERLTVKGYVPEENPSLPSADSLWKTAEWQEREIFDLFGIRFDGHPNLTRIMNPEHYQGHPLRKDYPRQGRGERRGFPVVERNVGSKT